ncbi:cytochrome P450 [Coleofasciculus sp. LEGE 07092]|uniref:cytochrome P450 n=1 Tax=Coleofasciculus sp. LEGE 07092 TaxID=2777969 RepID=UPI0018806480|nr:MULTISPECIES: cytochrome P450 [unclassified Coleofasciculus]MBE9126529.1 cytochrome P450 [Coleofasciculus sp. LEGE 07081]MBE9149963.1 cytochrome P450 [Coleofasciculus sp. LEGE 07092]
MVLKLLYPLVVNYTKKKGFGTEPLKHFLVGLFGVNSEQHRQHRQLMMPAFHKQRLESYRDDMVAMLDELQSVLKGEAPTVEQLQQLPLLDRVVKESLRVLSPVPWNGRVTSQPTELGDYALPTGTEVFVSLYHTHHMSELYPDPEAFNPQRWETIRHLQNRNSDLKNWYNINFQKAKP